MKKVISLLLIVLIILLLFTFTSILLQTGRNPSTVTIEIKLGLNANETALLLRGQNVIRSKKAFKLMSYALGLQGRLQAGKYAFNPHETLLQVLIKLGRGYVLLPSPLKVVFPEGTSIYKMGTLLEKAGMRDYENFRKLAEGKRSLEGYLFPDTYVFDASITAETLAQIMRDRFDAIIGKYWNENGKKSPLSFYQTLIMASIIEKEAKRAEERPIIASVFYNRIRIDMPLAADPTIKYALERPTKRVYVNQLQVSSPYNTYKRLGLPPTPICNPGLDAFKAAVYPAKTEYLFFVARKDGSHIFSKNWEEHQKARSKVSD